MLCAQCSTTFLTTVCVLLSTVISELQKQLCPQCETCREDLRTVITGVWIVHIKGNAEGRCRYTRMWGFSEVLYNNFTHVKALYELLQKHFNVYIYIHARADIWITKWSNLKTRKANTEARLTGSLLHTKCTRTTYTRLMLGFRVYLNYSDSV